MLKSAAAVGFYYRRLLTPFIIRNRTLVDHSQRTLVMKHELFRHLEIEIFVAARHVRRAAAYVQDVILACDSRVFEVSPATRDDLRRIGMEEPLRQLRGTFTHHYVVTFRRVLPDDTLISMTAGAEEPWYALSFITYAEPREPFLAVGTFLLKSMIALFGARPHWGKFCPLSPEEAAALYPRLPEFREICRRVDPQGVFQHEFTRRVLGF